MTTGQKSALALGLNKPAAGDIDTLRRQAAIQPQNSS